MFFTVAALAVLATVLFGMQLYQHQRDQLLQQFTSVMAQASTSEIRRISSDLRRHAANVRELEQSPVIQNFLASHSSRSQSFAGNSAEFWRNLVAGHMRATMTANPEYMQLRIVATDDAGQELVRLDRVDERIVEAPRDNLQTKGHRYYYQDALKLTAQEIYLSRLDLNRELGVVEVPWKPTYRVITPVFDDMENRRALIIANVDARGDLAEIAAMGSQFTQDLPTETYLATAYGSWAVHPNSEHLFGADLETGHSLAADEPQLAMMADELVADAHSNGHLDRSQIVPGTGLVHLSLLSAGQGDQHRYLKLFHVLPEAAFRSAVTWAALPLLLAAAFLGVLLLVLVLVFVYRQLKPLEEMTELARRAARGDYEAPLPLTSGNDEVGMLASAFRALLREVHLREQALHDSKDFLDVVLQGIAEGVAAVDSGGCILRVNRAMGEIFGYLPSELEGIAIENLVPADARAGHTQLRETYAQHPETRRLGGGRQLYGQRRDGSTFPVDLALTPVTQGSRAMTVVTAVDATSRVQADRDIRDLNRTLENRVAQRTAELEQAQQRMQLATKASGIGLWTFHLKDKTVEWDDGMYRLYGFDKNLETRALINAWRKAVLPDDLPEADMLLAEAAKQSGKLDLRFRIRRSDGQIRHIHAIGVAIRNSAGQPVSIIGTNHDQTEQIQSQALMEEARDAALQASRAKGDFLANMSHEIRTPMNGIIGMCNLLLDTDLDEQQQVRAHGIRTSADALLTIINDILDYSKVEAGRVDIEPVDFRMDHLLSDLASTMAVKAHEKGVELICPAAVIPPDFTRFHADAGRIRQVLTNLLSNAIKFTDKGEVAVDVQILSADAGMATIRFEVADTGIGIAPATISNLFERFVQADSSTTRFYGGTGLGLAISKHLVELMGGDIGVESEPGHGSTFWFTLPLQRASDHAVDDDTSLTLPGRHRVLTVDDSERYTHLMSELLACWGVEHEASTSGPEALHRIHSALES
ncbi:MAG: ATP-binding protein, partial [Oceanococcaceae bacterium]